MELRDYQADLLEAVRTAWRNGFRRPCMVLGCGGGKSVVAAEVVRRTTAGGKRVLFLVHRRELIAQMRGHFLRAGADMDLVEAVMVQTACRRVARLREPNLIVVDECHHTLAASYRKILDAFPAARAIGLTATPERLDGRGLGAVYDILVKGVSTKWLIERGFLADYDLYAPTVADLRGMRVARGEYVVADAEARMTTATVFGDVIRHYQALGAGRQAICYCVSVRHSQLTAQAFQAAGVEAAHLDGETPDTTRAQIIDDFRAGKIRILCNVDLVGEGFDVPDCGCVILLRPTQSLTIYIQQAMRCMRPQPGKRALILDHVGNCLRHGLPDDDREWSLDGREGAGEPREKNTVAVRVCPACFRAYRPAPVCPYCGAEPPSQARAVEEKAEAELKPVARAFGADTGCPPHRGSPPGEASLVVRETPAACRDYWELAEYGKRHGYKRGWAYYQAKLRGFMG